MAVQAYDHPIPRPRVAARLVLRLNALAALVAGVAMLLLAGPIARAAGISDGTVLAVIGVVLLAFGSNELAVAVGRRLRRIDVRLFALTDLACVAAGVALIVARPVVLTFLERGLVAGVAGVLAWFAVAGFRAARNV